MATNKVYATPGSDITFKSSAGSAVWTPQNIAAGAGRIGAVYDRGSGSQPVRYRWRMQTRWAATAASGDQLRLYLITSNASATAAQTDGGVAFGDAGQATETLLANCCQFLGAVISSAVSQQECASGVVEIYDRYFSVGCFNASATKALTNTAGDHVITFTPEPDDIQAAA